MGILTTLAIDCVLKKSLDCDHTAAIHCFLSMAKLFLHTATLMCNLAFHDISIPGGAILHGNLQESLALLNTLWLVDLVDAGDVRLSITSSKLRHGLGCQWLQVLGRQVIERTV